MRWDTRAIGAVAVVLLAACSDQPRPSRAVSKAPVSRDEAVTMSAEDGRIQWRGRVDRRAGAHTFTWPASGFVVRFEGSAIALRVLDAAAPVPKPAPDWLSVIIDDGAPTPVQLAFGQRDVIVANFLGPGPHTLVVQKRTEASLGLVTLRAIVLPKGGRFLPPAAPPKRTLLAIGDSITAGFGLDGSSAECPFSADTEDATRTYAALAARELNASYVAIAWSGKGLVQNVDPDDKSLLFDMLDRAVPADPASAVPLPAADIVVLNLGTNDYAGAIPPPPPTDFAAGADRALAMLRETYPEALIVVVVGPLLYDRPGLRGRAIPTRLWKTAVRKRRDARIQVLEVWADPKEGAGCQMHPNAKTHGRLAVELTEFIRAHGGVRDAAR